MSWDEAAIGYNGFGIWTVHRDEWLHRIPIAFKSFGDFKAPFVIYVNGFFTLLFGLNLWAVRLPFVLFAVGTVIGVVIWVYLMLQYFIPSEEFWTEHKKSLQGTLIGSAVLIAFSPWHIFFSRASFESGVALCFVIWGGIFFLSSLRSTRPKMKYLLTFASVLSLVLSLYTYHSAKIFVPFLVLLVFSFCRKQIFSNKKLYFYSSIFGILLLLPLVANTVWGNGSERLSQTSILAESNLSIAQKMMGVGSNFLTHFSIPFLVDGQTPTLRHGDGKWGVLYLTELLLTILTFSYLCFQKYKKNNTPFIQALYKLSLFAFLWIIIGIIPASIGFEVPHSNRALFSYPGYVVIESVGIFLILKEISEHKAIQTNSNLILKAIFGVGLIIHLFLVVSFFHDYFTKYEGDSVSAFNYGYEQAFQKIIPLENEVDNVVVTSAYGQPYIYALFFRHTNPIFYHGGSLFKYIFPDKVTVGDLMRKNALIIATPEEIDPSLADSLVIAPNGEVRFVIIRTKSE